MTSMRSTITTVALGAVIGGATVSLTQPDESTGQSGSNAAVVRELRRIRQDTGDMRTAIRQTRDSTRRIEGFLGPGAAQSNAGANLELIADRLDFAGTSAARMLFGICINVTPEISRGTNC
jgi:hypothetical protein